MRNAYADLKCYLINSNALRIILIDIKDMIVIYHQVHVVPVSLLQKLDSALPKFL